MRRPTGHRTSTATDLATILANQSDPTYMAVVARQRAALMAERAWRYNPKTGEWYLKRVLRIAPSPDSVTPDATPHA